MVHIQKFILESRIGFFGFILSIVRLYVWACAGEVGLWGGDGGWNGEMELRENNTGCFRCTILSHTKILNFHLAEVETI